MARTRSEFAAQSASFRRTALLFTREYTRITSADLRSIGPSEYSKSRTQEGAAYDHAPMWTRVRPFVSWVTAGQLDAGLASLGSFVAGLYAVRELSPMDLGAYALMFSAYVMVTQFSAQLIYTPSEVHSVGWDQARRLSGLRESTRKGAKVAVAASTGMVIAALPLVGSVSGDTVVAFVGSGLLLAMISPLQDHVRRTFHLAGQSWNAATMSAALVVATSGGIFGVGALSPAWAPFGGLFIGNVVSLMLSRRWLHGLGPAPDVPSYRELFSRGRWLLGVGLASTGFGYLAATLVKILAGVTALGYVEGARVVAQPINIVSLGLVAVVAPQAMEAALEKDHQRARRWRVRFLLLLSVVAVPYALLIGGSWSANPLVGLIPNAYAVEGLVALSLVAAFLNSASNPWRAELMAARLEGVLGRSVAVTGFLESAVVAGTAGAAGPAALPIGHGIAAAARWMWFQLRMTRWYQK